jgi:hypothetical protein
VSAIGGGMVFVLLYLLLGSLFNVCSTIKINLMLKILLTTVVFPLLFLSICEVVRIQHHNYLQWVTENMRIKVGS